MADKKFGYKPIYPGFPWDMTLRLLATPVLFPEGVKLRAQIRTAVGAPILATLTTEAGTLARVDDERVAIALDPAITTRLKAGTIVLELIRTDVTPAVHLGVRLTIQVKTPVTAAR